MNRRGGASISVGASSILVIFVLLCLTTFSTLSLLSANADLRLTRKAEAASNQYWEANNKAQDILAEIDTLLTMAFAESLNRESYMDTAFLSLAAAGPQQLEFHSGPGGAGFVSYTVPAGEAQELLVEIELDYSAAHFRKTMWLMRSTAEWDDLEDSLGLWDGGDLAGLPVMP